MVLVMEGTVEQEAKRVLAEMVVAEGVSSFLHFLQPSCPSGRPRVSATKGPCLSATLVPEGFHNHQEGLQPNFRSSGYEGPHPGK